MTLNRNHITITNNYVIIMMMLQWKILKKITLRVSHAGSSTSIINDGHGAGLARPGSRPFYFL